MFDRVICSTTALKTCCVYRTYVPVEHRSLTLPLYYDPPSCTVLVCPSWFHCPGASGVGCLRVFHPISPSSHKPDATTCSTLVFQAACTERPIDFTPRHQVNWLNHTHIRGCCMSMYISQKSVLQPVDHTGN